MTIRHKATGKVYEVVEESVTYYVTRGVEVQAFRKDECEPVQAETWRDVTGECEETNLDAGEFGAMHNQKYFYAPPGYRLHKVRVFEAIEGRYQIAPGTRLKTAFIIERKES